MELVTYPSSVLNAVCVRTVYGHSYDRDLQNIINKMADVMYTSDGVGLASPQVGLTNSIILVDPSGGMSQNELIAMVNPKIVWMSDENEEGAEGCLSLPGVSVSVVRSVACDVEFYDIGSFQMKTMRCTGLKSRIVQHETDHLEGVMLIDKVGSLARRIALQDLKQVNR